MKKEDRIIIITMILNFIVAIMKLAAGIIFSFSTLISDSVQSFTDFITDITSLIANRIGKRRANKTYPFGYGQVYSVANLFTGALLFLIGINSMYSLKYSLNNFRTFCISLILFITHFNIIFLATFRTYFTNCFHSF